MSPHALTTTRALVPSLSAALSFALGIRSGEERAPVLRPLPAGLVRGPEVVGQFFVEHWIKGPASSRRLGALRRLLGSTVCQRTYSETSKRSSEPGADRVSVQKVEISYCVVAATRKEAA